MLKLLIKEDIFIPETSVKAIIKIIQIRIIGRESSIGCYK